MKSLLINRILYICFLILGFYQLLVSKDYFQASGSFGIGLAFDPVFMIYLGHKGQ
jgi:pantoate kinase